MPLIEAQYASEDGHRTARVPTWVLEDARWRRRNRERYAWPLYAEHASGALTKDRALMLQAAMAHEEIARLRVKQEAMREHGVSEIPPDVASAALHVIEEEHVQRGVSLRQMVEAERNHEARLAGELDLAESAREREQIHAEIEVRQRERLKCEAWLAEWEQLNALRIAAMNHYAQHAAEAWGGDREG